MSEQDELYVKSQENWQKEQLLLIEIIKANLLNSEMMISLHTKNKELLQESLAFEQNNLERNIEFFEEWELNNQ